MTTFSRTALAIFLLIVCALFASATLDTWHRGFPWHDQQRLYQLILLCAFAGAAIFLPTPTLPRSFFIPLYIVLGFGLLSVFFAEFPAWAFKEWARYAGLILLVLVIAYSARQACFFKAILYLLASAAFLNAFQFIVYYCMAFLTEIYMFDVDLLFNGFSNPRFLNQFQVLFMPVLAGLVVLHWNNHGRYQRLLSGLFFITLLVHWCIALSLGSRGLWLGLAASHLALLLFFPRFWRLLAIQAATGILGFLLYQLLFLIIPEWLGQESLLRSSLRFGLSKREVLWDIAWHMFLENPWLGVGPMHFAATLNPIAAHPHQVVLQWLAEWGLFATLAACLLAFIGMWHGLHILRSPQAEPIDAALWLSIAGALAVAQVDGIFVMPYTETWLAILIGLALALWSAPTTQVAALQQGRSSRRFIPSLSYKPLALIVILTLGNILINEVPTLPLDSEAHMEKHGTGYVPRFWLQGWIPMDGSTPRTRAYTSLQTHPNTHDDTSTGSH